MTHPAEHWIERRQRQLRSPLLRRLDRSFPLRLLLALAGAILALGVVNRWEQCRDQNLARGCLWHDAGGVISVDNLEALSIVTASLLFVLEGGKRRQRQHIEAVELILSCQQAGIRYSLARNEAIEMLCEAGIGFDGFDLSGIDLHALRAPGVRWPDVNLVGTDLQAADLRGAELRGADLRQANLQDADLRSANLAAADLRGARLTGARLEAARLEGAQLPSATLDPAG
jgi:type II secretory pathway pseudopilin PulG